MSAGILYYSYTGRNRKLSKLVSDKLNLERIEITESKKRSPITIMWDIMLGRIPKAQPEVSTIDKFDKVIIFAPVWMGVAASPLRKYLKYIQKSDIPYIFISLSGGANESNSGLEKDMLHYAGRAPKLLLDMHVSQVIDGSPTLEETKKYELSDEMYNMFAQQAANGLEKIGL